MEALDGLDLPAGEQATVEVEKDGTLLVGGPGRARLAKWLDDRKQQAILDGLELAGKAPAVTIRRADGKTTYRAGAETKSVEARGKEVFQVRLERR